MSDMNKQDLNQEAVPFFARYLEGQINFIEEIPEEEAQAVGGSGKVMTKKFPSDQADSSVVDRPMTAKYPSDQEDSGGGPVMTLKFPSDQEDMAVTQKYPSDGDDYVCHLE